LDLGETPDRDALRELEEETGYRADKITFAGVAALFLAVARGYLRFEPIS